MDSERTPPGPAAGPLGLSQWVHGSGLRPSPVRSRPLAMSAASWSPESLYQGLMSCRLRVVSGEGPREKDPESY